MVAIKKSVYLSDEATRVIGPEPASLSGRINSIVLRYGEIIRRSTPALTVPEWCAICDALNGTHMEIGDGPDTVRYMWAEIADADRLDGLGAKWGIDAQDLAGRIQAMGYPEQVAIAEVVGRFWGSARLNEADNETLLREAGAVIAG